MSDTLQLQERFYHLSDDAWLRALLQSINDREVDGQRFPGFPDEYIQKNFVGGSYENTIHEAFSFYRLMKAWAVVRNHPFQYEKSFLDFGCGWGRYLRFFWKDIAQENLYGCDVLTDILDVCRATEVPGSLHHIEPLGNLPYGDKSFDFMMAYSVFTHLPEHVHLHWMRELARVAKPNAIFCLTLEPRRFLDFVGGLSADADSEWHRMMSQFAPRAKTLRDQFDTGSIAYLPTGGGDPLPSQTYGDAAVPLRYIEQHWSEYFEIVDYLDDPNRFWQAVLTVQRKS
jgi:ubiquinone/menaquinone biosynthesis C-methylase UbiE